MNHYRTMLRDNEVDRCTVMGLYGAMINGHLAIVQLILDNQPELANWPKLEDGPDVLRCLINRDRPEMLKYFRHERGMRLDSQYLEEAILHDCRFLVQLIRELDLVGPTSFALDISTLRGNIAMLKTLTQSVDNPPYSTRAMSGAAEEGHLLIVQYLHAQRASCSRQALDLAARRGHFEVVEYLFEQYGARCSEWAVYRASACGHERVVSYLVTRVACDLEKCVAVAKSQGHLRIVKIFEEYGATHIQSIAPQRSSKYLARRRQQQRVEFEVSQTKVIFREVERLLLASGLCMPPDVLP